MTELKDEPIEKIYERAKKGLALVSKMDKNDEKFDLWLQRFFAVCESLLERLVWLEAIKMFGDSKLVEEE